ncbi:MAG: ATP-binding protein, partial [Deltaproteobacteria bacterium]|nr:ATP-binding protein [Deltaproteobacteria bacterium]
EVGLAKRAGLVEDQRAAFVRVAGAVSRQFEDRIRVTRIDCAVSDGLGRLIQELRQKGISQWWNGLDNRHKPSPQALYDKLVARQLSELGVSRTVADRFEEAFTEARRLELRALRSPDCQLLYLRVDGGEYREIGRLSGGRRVSLILSLLLEAHDDRPLVIDQPEDELDNEFMWETVLPVLRRLKGRRQVIVATHDANIVVNGDADLVVLLEAEADHGHVAVSGAIEDPVVRTAIVETVDGGRVAFELRKAKYGF